MNEGRKEEKGKEGKTKEKQGRMMAKHSPEFQQVKFNFSYTYFSFFLNRIRGNSILSKVNKFTLGSKSAS